MNISTSQDAILREIDDWEASGAKSGPLAGVLKNIESQARISLDEVSKIKVAP